MFLAATLLVVGCAVFAEPAAAHDSLPSEVRDLVLFDSKGPRCLDGSPAGFYVGRDPPTSKVVVWLEGGGLCENLDDCKDRSTGDLGSSADWAKTRNESLGLLSSNPALNPDFADFTHVFVPYCSGDLWAGQGGEATNPWAAGSNDDDGSGATFYFQGHSILEKVLDAAVGEIDELVLTGCSAGGIGTFGNCDYTAERFPNARVVCRPEAGYFGLPLQTFEEFEANTTAADPHHFAVSGWTANIDNFVASTQAFDECLQHGFSSEDRCPNATMCCSAPPYFYPFIKTPMFISENTADSYQVFEQGQAPVEKWRPALFKYVDYLRDALAGSMESTVVRGAKMATDGLFAPACLAHCMAWSDSKAATVGGKTLEQAFGDWYRGRGSSHMLIDDSEDKDQLLACSDYF